MIMNKNMILTSRSSLIQRDMSASVLLPSGFNEYLKIRYKNTFKTPPDEKNYSGHMPLEIFFGPFPMKKYAYFRALPNERVQIHFEEFNLQGTPPE